MFCRWISVDAALIIDQTMRGTVEGHFSSDIDSDGRFKVFLRGLDNEKTEKMFVDTNIEWSTLPSCDYAGLMSVSSVVKIHETVDRTSKLRFAYGNHDYSLVAALSDSADYEKLTVQATGTYGGDVGDWHVSLDDSRLVYEADVIGFASGYTSCLLQQDGRLANLMLILRVRESSGTEQLNTNTVVTWFFPDDVGAAGHMELTSSLRFLLGVSSDDKKSYFTWRITDWLKYESKDYTFQVLHLNDDMKQNVYAWGAGEYGASSFTNW
jgi:hypothetical protein